MKMSTPSPTLNASPWIMIYPFRLPDGATGHDSRAGPVFLPTIDLRCAEVIFLAAAAGRHAG
jgi:hypothetical protein